MIAIKSGKDRNLSGGKQAPLSPLPPHLVLGMKNQSEEKKLEEGIGDNDTVIYICIYSDRDRMSREKKWKSRDICFKELTLIKSVFKQ